MVNVLGVAVFHSVKQLQEYSASRLVISDIVAFFCDFGKEISFRAVLQQDEDAVFAGDDIVHGQDIWVQAGVVMQLDLPGLEFLLSWIKSSPVEGLHSEILARYQVFGLVDSAISSNSKDVNKLISVGDQTAYAAICRATS